MDLSSAKLNSTKIDFLFETLIPKRPSSFIVILVSGEKDGEEKVSIRDHECSILIELRGLSLHIPTVWRGSATALT